MSDKAVVFDNSGTLLERYRAIKNLSTGEIFTNVNSLQLIDNIGDAALVILQFDSSCLTKMDSNIKIYDLIKKYDIEFDVSYSNYYVSKEDVLSILKNDSSIIRDISDAFDVLRGKVKNMHLCNGSAIILDLNSQKVAYTITSAGKLFPKVLFTVNELKKNGVNVYIASGDRSGAIKKLANIIQIDESNAFPTADSKNKCEIVSSLQNQGFNVMMVGDGPNDILAFNKANVSVLTLEQKEEVSPKMFDHADHVIHNISEVLNIDF